MSQESFVREEMFNQLILSVISAQNEIKNAIRVASNEITKPRKEMKTVNHNFEQQLKELKQENSKLKAQLENVHPSAEVDRPECTEQEKLAHDLFTGNLFPEPFIEHPLDENSKRKRQFSWDLYKKIMEDVHGSPVNKKTFNAARDHLMLFKLPALIRQIKNEYKFEAGKPFNAVDPRGKLRAVELLEEMAAPYILLRVCSGSWGANLLIRYYWSRGRKNKYSNESISMQGRFNNIKKLTTNNFKAEKEPEADNASEEDGPCHSPAPTSAPSEDSDSSEESDGSSLDMASIFPQVTYGNKRSSDDKRKSKRRTIHKRN
ncbi:hypothetical protein RMATCC62417_01611 [Rhizopus microsporus]|nr:hypothetical protein RMATCC62417_01611 [Rhizopus microsporus]